MGLVKTALIIGGVVLGLGAIGGITAGVVTRQSSEESSLVIPNKEAESDIQADESSASHSNEPAISQITAESILKQISEEDIVVKKEEKETKPSENYAFDLDKKSLAIKSDKNKILEGYETTLTIQNSNNSLEKLNNGELVVNVHLKNQKTNDEANRNLKITTFKKADKALLDLLEQKSTKPSSDYSLSLIPKTTNASKFITVEELNETKDVMTSTNPSKTEKISGLTTWANQSEKNNGDALKGVSIEGEVKVVDVKKDQTGVTTFTLKPTKQTKYLTLIKVDENNVVTKALFKQVTTTNLLATKVFVKSIKNDPQATKTYREKLLAKTQETSLSNGFKLENNQVKVEVKKQDQADQKSDVTLIPFVLKEPKKEQAISIDLGLEVEFGTDNNKFVLDSTKELDAKKLKEAGFSFHFYTRLLKDKDDKTAENITADDVTKGDHKLSEFLINANYNTPINKPTNPSSDTPENAVVNNNFFVLSLASSNLKDGTKLETKMWNSIMKRNYIIFSDYSYISAKSEEMEFALKEKVLFTPYLTLLNVHANEVEARAI